MSSPESSTKRCAALELSLVTSERFEDVVRRGGDRALFAVRYGSQRAAITDRPFAVLDVPCPVLDDGLSAEIWRSARPVVARRVGRFVCAQTGQALFGAAVCPTTGNLESDTLGLYRELLGIAAAAGYDALQRLWNYIPRINSDEGGVERYKRFSAGRARGYQERFGASAERHFPASSAVGTNGDAMIVCFLAAREAGHHHENPRQVSAYRYPPRYGEKSPSFARATLSPEALADAFFLSGTASVVGHESRHDGDVLHQFDETLRNIETLSGAVGAAATRPAPCLERFDYLKIHLRHPADLPAVRDALARRLGPAVPSVWLAADICRAELLLEIEGVAFPRT